MQVTGGPTIQYIGRGGNAEEGERQDVTAGQNFRHDPRRQQQPRQRQSVRQIAPATHRKRVYPDAMPVYIALLRGVNLLRYNRMKMEALREVCESLRFQGAQTYVQSGNVVFRTAETDAAKIVSRLESAIEKRFGFRPPVILRTIAEWRAAIARNPYAERSDIPPSKLLVHFLAADPGAEAREKARRKAGAVPEVPEELHIFERELFIYYPNGMGRPKLPMPAVERALNVTGSGRNWNSVTKLMQMAEALEAAAASTQTAPRPRPRKR